MTSWKLYIEGMDPVDPDRILVVRVDGIQYPPSYGETFFLRFHYLHNSTDMRSLYIRAVSVNRTVQIVETVALPAQPLGITTSITGTAESWFSRLAISGAATAQLVAHGIPLSGSLRNGSIGTFAGWNNNQPDPTIPAPPEPECHCSSRQLATVGHDTHCLYFAYVNRKRSGGGSTTGGMPDVSN